MIIIFKYKTETKTCYRFEAGSKEKNDLITLYLKKEQVNNAGINPQNGLTVNIEERKED